MLQTDEFANKWEFLLTVENLFVPVELSIGEETTQLLNRHHLDFSSSLIELNNRNAIAIYSDPSLFVDGVQYIAASVVEVLRSCFFLSELETIHLNYQFSSSDPHPHYCVRSKGGESLDKINLARLLGAIGLGRFPNLVAEQHCEEAERLLWEDKIFESFYHSIAARSLGAPRDDYFFAEVDALFSFGFMPQVDQYLKWYQQKGEHVLYRAEFARWLVVCGNFDLALKWLEPLLADEELKFQSLYVRGLLNYKQKRFKEAVDDFRQCLSCFANHHEARLALGISLRNEGLRSDNPEILKEAATNLLEVAKAGGYHAAEALAHLGALMLSFRNWEKAELFLRKSLKLRENRATRGFLEQALAGQR